MRRHVPCLLDYVTYELPIVTRIQDELGAMFIEVPMQSHREHYRTQPWEGAGDWKG